jgi:hypothetical protein
MLIWVYRSRNNGCSWPSRFPQREPLLSDGHPEIDPQNWHLQLGVGLTLPRIREIPPYLFPNDFLEFRKS